MLDTSFFLSFGCIDRKDIGLWLCRIGPVFDIISNYFFVMLLFHVAWAPILPICASCFFPGFHLNLLSWNCCTRAHVLRWPRKTYLPRFFFYFSKAVANCGRCGKSESFRIFAEDGYQNTGRQGHTEILDPPQEEDATDRVQTSHSAFCRKWQTGIWNLCHFRNFLSPLWHPNSYMWKWSKIADKWIKYLHPELPFDHVCQPCWNLVGSGTKRY